MAIGKKLLPAYGRLKSLQICRATADYKAGNILVSGDLQRLPAYGR
jgi:hypothetical protein